MQWVGTRWFTSNEDQPIVPLQESQRCSSEQSHSQGDVSERINSDEADDVDVESLDQAETMSKATQTHDLPPIQVKTSTLPTERITEPGSLASFNASQNKVDKTSRRTASNLSTVSNLMSITTRSGRKYYKN
ncbi:unnamed protein product [Larinioides sclopetarius]|uniref:Uncharacterized protein n=1 Tax=Larinioides sclopetarius TaxID=280406 RepID=A0AAV2AM43_9ARAC